MAHISLLVFNLAVGAFVMNPPSTESMPTGGVEDAAATKEHTKVEEARASASDV